MQNSGTLTEGMILSNRIVPYRPAMAASMMSERWKVRLSSDTPDVVSLPMGFCFSGGIMPVSISLSISLSGLLTSRV